MTPTLLSLRERDRALGQQTIKSETGMEHVIGAEANPNLPGS
jgi:hypothetical protein